ncbi:MAG: hypothetical protein WBG50_00565 [Desulfomonilaceae bacterium]
MPTFQKSWPFILAQTIQDFGPQFAVPISTCIIALCALNLRVPDFWDQLWSVTGAILAIGVGANIFFSGYVAYRTPRISKLNGRITLLEEELDRRADDYFERVRRQLADCFTHLGFSTEERISLYAHEGRTFILCGRYSSNPNYDKRSSRMYPDDQGCLGEAWRSGQSFVEDLPDPQLETEAYIEAHTNDWKMPRDIVEKLSMKTRWLAGFRIEDVNQARPVAVIIFESTKPKLRKKSSLVDLMGSDKIEDLKEFLKKTEPMKPSYAFAKQEGF